MVQAIIMAGGEGSRLRPLTCDRPKPMVPMLNRPVMEHAIELLKRHGIVDIGVTLQYMPQEIINYFQDGTDFGVNMRYFVEETPLGTAGSVKNAEGFLKDTFIVVSGDALTDFNLSEALEFHQKNGSMATLVLTPVEIPLEYGVVITESNGKIQRFLEKPGWGEVFSDTVNTGIYILEPEVLNYVPAGQKYDFSQDLFPLLLQTGQPLYGVSLNGYWCDIGNLKQYQDAHYAAIDGKVDVIIRENSLGDKIYQGANCTVDPSAVINGPVMLGDNCQVHRHAVIGPYVVLGNNCKVEEGASLKHTVVWSGSYIGKRAEIRGAVLGSKVAVKDWTSVFEGAVVGDECILEENVKIKPGIKVWPHKIVEKGTQLDSSLRWGTRTGRSLFAGDGISGMVNITLTPECAAKLGAVYGSIFGSDSKALISCDHHQSTQMIKTAVQAGLMSVGISVLDGGNMITPVHRNSLRALNVAGGIHIKSSGTASELLHINFFKGDGSIIQRDLERKIENLYEREDFRRSSKHEVGGAVYMPGLSEAYINSLLKMVNTDIIRARRHKVISYVCGETARIAPQLFNELGCSVTWLGPEVDEPVELPELTSILEGVATEIVTANAGFGVVIDSNAEYLTMVDENGKIVNDDRLLALVTLIILDSNDRPVVAVPINRSGVAETMAMARNGSVIRTKTSPTAFMQEAMRPEIAGSQGVLNQSLMAFDALSTVVRIMEYMAEKDLSLAQALLQVPEFYMTRKQIPCPWNAKGKVIRRLIEETRGKQVELLDGVKVYHEDGWALVLPDAGEPRYNVYTEGFSYEFAESLADFYINKISQLKDWE